MESKILDGSLFFKNCNRTDFQFSAHPYSQAIKYVYASWSLYEYSTWFTSISTKIKLTNADNFNQTL